MSQAAAPLPEADNTQTGCNGTIHLASENEKHNVESNSQSTRASSTAVVETKKNAVLSTEADFATDKEAEAAGDTPSSPGDYPGGLKLASIVAALVLSIFLFSLDQVKRSLRVLP